LQISWIRDSVFQHLNRAYVNSTFFDCLPNTAEIVPNRDLWFHEVKYDGYRLIAVREDMRLRLFTRSGNDWTSRLPDGQAIAAEPAAPPTVEALHAAVLDKIDALCCGRS
jgi:ATP-dependent DNA ligase